MSGCDAKPPSEQIGYAICPLHQLSQRMPNYRTLKVWQHAQRLALECAKAAKRFPPEDCNVLKMQLLRACYSVPLNIAEGSGRKEQGSFVAFSILRGVHWPRRKPRSNSPKSKGSSNHRSMKGSKQSRPRPRK